MKNFNKYPKKDKQPKIDKLQINLFGYHAIHEAWLSPNRNIKKVFVTEKALENFKPYIKKAEELGLKRPKYELVERKQIDKTLGHDVVHQGIAAYAEPLPEMNAMDLIIKASSKEKAVFVLLDQVTDPHNVGAIMRSACAFDLSGMVMQTRFAPQLEGAVGKVASGGLEHVPVGLETNLSRAIETFKDNGYVCIALDERGEKTIGEFGNHDKVLLVMGAEGKGLRPSVRDHCTDVARIEMLGPLASINVSNAAAISFYALMGGK
jgi:23S rRNA (guanosine2251-2'-O)-methyltransferase